MKEKIEITPEFLAELKEKTGNINPDQWEILYPKVTSGWGFCVYNPKRSETIARIKGSGTVIKNKYIGPRKMAENNAEYIAAANPAVMLALIAKIEEQEMELHYMRSWAELDKEETSKQLAWIRELQKLLGLEVNGLTKNTRSEILEKIKSLVSDE